MSQTPTRRFVVCIADHPRVELIGRRITMAPRQRLVLGRGSLALGADALLDPRMSRRHSALVVTEQGLSVEDLGSRNGTLVDGHPVQRCLVRSHALLGLGRVLLQVWTEPDEPAPPPAPPPLVTQSPAMWPVLRALPVLAPTRTPVLLVGEEGVGKRTVAQAIHRLSGRKGPLVTLLPAAVPAEHAGLALHGHDANPAAEGALPRAEGGTLLLPRIEASTTAFQAELLSYLEDGLLRPTGGAARPSDVRLVLTMVREPKVALADGSLSQALWERLQPGLLSVPPFRERPEDTLLLTRHLARQHAGHPVELDRLLALLIALHDWPGNGQELSELLARLVAEQPDSSTLTTPPWGPDAFGPRARDVVSTFDPGQLDPSRRRP